MRSIFTGPSLSERVHSWVAFLSTFCILENLANGITANIGFSATQKDNLASNIFNGKSTIVNQFEIENVFNDNKKMYIFGNQNFNATGKIKVTIELVRKNISDW